MHLLVSVLHLELQSVVLCSYTNFLDLIHFGNSTFYGKHLLLAELLYSSQLCVITFFMESQLVSLKVHLNLQKQDLRSLYHFQFFQELSLSVAFPVFLELSSWELTSDSQKLELLLRPRNGINYLMPSSSHFSPQLLSIGYQNFSKHAFQLSTAEENLLLSKLKVSSIELRTSMLASAGATMNKINTTLLPQFFGRQKVDSLDTSLIRNQF